LSSGVRAKRFKEKKRRSKKSLKKRELSHAGNHHVAVWRLQKSQLHNDKEQKEAFGPAGDQEVLQFVPQAHSTQGS
jgi:hypothetical protein